MGKCNKQKRNYIKDSSRRHEFIFYGWNDRCRVCRLEGKRELGQERKVDVVLYDGVCKESTWRVR